MEKKHFEPCTKEHEDDSGYRISDETSGEYEFVSTTTSNQQNSVIQMIDEANADPMSAAKNENNVQIHTEAAAPKLLFKRNDTALGHDVMKCEVMHVKSPGDRSNQEDKNADKDDDNDDEDNDNDNDHDDNAVAPVDRSIDLQKNADIDSNRYDWDTIFLYLAQELIDPRTYVLFFNILLAHAGCQNTDIKISTIEEQTRKSVPLTIFQIFKYWKQGVGSDVNPKDIEDAFEKLGWKRQLDAFRNFMKSPPTLKENTKWHEPLNELATRQIHLEGHHGFLSLMPTAQEQIPADCNYQITKEIIVQQNINGGMRQWASSSNSSLTSAPFTSVSNSESGYGSCSYETARCNKHSESSNVHKSSADDSKQDLMTQETRQTNESLNGHEHNESETINLLEHTKIETLSEYEYNKKETLNGDKNNKSRPLNKNGHSINETLNEEDHNKGKTVIEHENFTSEAKNGHEHFTNETLNRHENKTNETLIGHAHHTNEALNGNEDIAMSNATSGLRNNNSCQAKSSSWSVSVANSSTKSKSLLKESNEQNRKRHNTYTDDIHSPSYQFKRRKKCVQNRVSFERKYKIAARQKKHLATHLVELVNQCFESKVPVDMDKYDIFINNLLTRLAEWPQKDDIISLRMQSFDAADCFTTHKGEIIGVIDSENHLLLLREKEWTTLKTYVKYARPVMEKKQPDMNTDFLFLCYDGKPLVHAK